MTKLLSLIILSMLFSFSVQAKEYTFDEVKECEPLDYTINRLCDLNNVFVTGKIKSYYENGNLKAEGNFKDGKAEGVAKVYHENGSLKSEISYKNGQRQITKIYYPNGNIFSETTFKNDKAEGESKTYRDNGKLLSEINFKNDKLEGLGKYYYENGDLEAIVDFKDDKIVSGYGFNQDGQIQEITEEILLKINNQILQGLMSLPNW